MKNKIIKNILKLFALSVLVLFSACKLEVNQKVETEANNEPKLVHIKPILQIAAARTAMADYGIVPEEDETYEEAVLKHLTKFNLFWAVDKESMIKSSYLGSYNSSRVSLEYLSENVLIPEGTYCFELVGFLDNDGYRSFGSLVENVTISADSENEIQFIMVPESYGNNNYKNINFTFRFPAGTNPSLKDYNAKRYSKSDNYTAAGTYSQQAIEPVITPSEEDETIPVMTFDVRVVDSDTYRYNYVFDFTFINTDKTTGDVTGIFQYSTASRVSVLYDMKEDYTVPKFLNAYKLIYHVNDTVDEETGETDHSKDVIQYYASAFGYELYDKQNSTWFTDAACTIFAQPAAPATTKGDKNFYKDSEKNYKVLTIKDFDDNVIYEQNIKNGNYFFVQKEGSVVINGFTTSLSKDGFYVSGYYLNKDKTSSLMSNVSMYLTENLTVYVDYQQPYTLTLKEIDTDVVLRKIQIENNTYRLSNNSISSYISTASFNDFIIAKYITDGETPELLSKDVDYTAEGDVVVYGIKAKSKTFTLNYNTAYELVFEGENAELISTTDWYKDNAGKSLWNDRNKFSSYSARNITYNNTVYYGPINPFEEYSANFDVVTVVSEEETLTPDIGHFDYQNINVNKSDSMWVVYNYKLNAGVRYNVYWYDINDDYINIVDSTTGKMLVGLDGDATTYFIAPSTGIYEVYVSPYYTSRSINSYFHIYEDPYSTVPVSVTTKGQVEILVSEPDEETGVVTLSTKDKFSSYEWKMGNKVLGTGSSYEFDPSKYFAGETYQIVFTADKGLKTTVTIKIPAEEENDE